MRADSSTIYLLVQLPRLITAVLFALAVITGDENSASSSHAAAFQVCGNPINLKIVVSGAGPAALLFCHRLLQLNPNISMLEIYERRPRPKRYSEIVMEDVEHCLAGDFAFGFGLGIRAQAILKPIPHIPQAIQAISEVIDLGRHSLWMVNRQEFCAELIYLLEQHHKGRFNIHFGTSVTGVIEHGDDVRCAIIVNETNATSKHVPYDLLIAADGIHSAIRTTLVDGELGGGKVYYSPSTWKALQLPPQPNLKMSPGTSFPRFQTSKDLGRLLPRYKDRWVWLNFRNARHRTHNPFDATNPSELQQGLIKHFPNLTNFPSNEAFEQFLSQPPGKTTYMQLERHVSPRYRVALIGDAAVGMYSLLGQGCAYALQSANLLAEQVAQIQGYNTDPGDDYDEQRKAPWEKNLLQALYVVSNSTVIEGRAIADLNLLSHGLKVPLVGKWIIKPALSKVSLALAAQPMKPYSEVAKEAQLAIQLSKLVWRLQRRTTFDVASSKPPK